MAIEKPEAPRTSVNDPGVAEQYKRKKHPASNFEMIAWLFMRISGVLLTVLVVGHLLVNLVLGDGVHQIDFAFVAGKWATPFWQFWDLAMLWLAMLHGANGIRTIINDYARKPAARKVFKTALYFATVAITILGTLVIFTFDPCSVASNGELFDNVPQFCHSISQ